MAEKKDRLDEASDYFTKAITLQPDVAEAHECLSEVLKKLGKSSDVDVHRKIVEQYHVPLMGE